MYALVNNGATCGESFLKSIKPNLEQRNITDEN